jgi:hypothetical protein
VPEEDIVQESVAVVVAKVWVALVKALSEVIPEVAA